MTTRVQPQDKFVNANGIRIHYLDWGGEDKPMLLVLHGLRGHCHSWDSFSEPMSADYHVLALDRRGRGDTDWAKDGDYTTLSCVADLEGFCQELGLKSFVLVGHSSGGRHSMTFTARNPDTVQRLVIVDIPPSADPPDRGRIQNELINVPEEFDTFEDLYTHLRKENPYPPEDVLRRRLKYQTKTLPNGKLGWKYDVAVRQQMRTDTAPREDLWEYWKKITCPTLLIRGMETDAITPETAKEMLDSHPNAQMAEMPRAGHMAFEDNPDAFLKEVSGWLKKHS